MQVGAGPLVHLVGLGGGEQVEEGGRGGGGGWRVDQVQELLRHDVVNISIISRSKTLEERKRPDLETMRSAVVMEEDGRKKEEENRKESRASVEEGKARVKGVEENKEPLQRGEDGEKRSQDKSTELGGNFGLEERILAEMKGLPEDNEKLEGMAKVTKTFVTYK